MGPPCRIGTEEPEGQFLDVAIDVVEAERIGPANAYGSRQASRYVHVPGVIVQSALHGMNGSGEGRGSDRRTAARDVFPFFLRRRSQEACGGTFSRYRVERIRVKPFGMETAEIDRVEPAQPKRRRAPFRRWLAAVPPLSADA